MRSRAWWMRSSNECPDVSLLATSREGLGLAGERIVAVPPLGVPAGDADVDEVRRAEAVCLFWDRASAAKHDFALTDRNVGAVGVLCRRLDGIPLAIELAAARVRSLSPEDLVSRLDQRFKLLTHGSRAALERHQTLRSTIDWSYDLLTPTERHALQRLSVFAGGCDLGGRGSGAARRRPRRGRMWSTCWVNWWTSPSSSSTTPTAGCVTASSRPSASTRGSASTRVAIRSAVRRRHADHYVALAEAAGPHLRGREHLEWTSVVARDIDNFRAALDWAVETPSPEHALRLVAPLAVQGRIGELAMELGRDRDRDPRRRRSPALSRGRRLGRVGRHDGVAISSGPQTSSLPRNEPKRRSVYGLGPWRGLRRPSRSIAMTSRRHDVTPRSGSSSRVASGDPYELAHALIMLGGALQITEPTLDAAIADR